MGKGGVAEGRCVGRRYKIGIRTPILEEEVNDFLVSGSPCVEEARASLSITHLHVGIVLGRKTIMIWVKFFHRVK